MKIAVKINKVLSPTLSFSLQDTDQGKKPGEYGDPFGLLERYARARWPQAQERLQQWSYSVRLISLVACACHISARRSVSMSEKFNLLKLEDFF